MYDLIAFCKWCQHLPLPELARNLRELGFDGVDLPCRPGAPISHENGPEKLPEAKRIFADHGLTLPRLVTSLENADREAERLLATCSELGITRIRIAGQSLGSREYRDRDPREVLVETRKRLVALGALLAKHGVKGAIQNHSGNTLAVNLSSCLLMLQDCDPEWVGVQYDPGHCTLSGEPVALAAGLLGPYLHSVNLKSPRHALHIDPQNSRLTHTAVWVPLRDGYVDVPAVLAALDKAGYREAISLHAEYRTYFYRVEECLEATNQLMAGDVAYVREVLAQMS